MPRSDTITGLLLILATPPCADDLTIATWGGAYEAAQREALFEPFAAATGAQVEVVQYDGMADALAARADLEGWDVIDMEEDQAIAACDAGDLLPLDVSALLGNAAREDFTIAELRGCSVPQNVYASVIAYDDRAFPGVKPTRLEDFFDAEHFPGRRAVARDPDVILEWALMADGVPAEQVYDLLSTDRGLRLAFRRLDAIREEIVWTDGPAESAEMLADGRAAMAGGYNGRFFAAATRDAAPIVIVWDGRLIGHEVWAIPAAADNPDDAREFLAFASRPAQMARLAELIPYGPARLSAFERIGLNPESGAPMRDHLPNAPQHGGRSLVRDAPWYANTAKLRSRRFEQWLSETP